MEKILVPMDFTEVSLRAFHYALNHFAGAEIHALHVNSSLSTKDNYYLKPGQTKESLLQEELKNEITNSLESEEDISRIQIKVLPGEFLEVLNKYCEEEKMDCVVMGMRDKYSLVDKLIGTHSLATVKTLHVPVFLIPRFTKKKPIKKVLIASDKHLSDPKYLESIKKCIRGTQSFLKFVHIKQSTEDSYDIEKETIINNFFLNESPEFAMEISSINGEDVTRSLLDSAYNFGSDLLILFPDQQNFLQALLFKSISKEIIEKSSIPLLFINT